MRLLCFLLVAVAARATSFGNPIIHVDEQYYLLVADRLLHGDLPYVDVWDRKPIGLFLLYVPAALAGAHRVIAYQAMAFGAVVLTAWLIATLADRAGWRRGALAAGMLYILWLELANGQGGQAPVFYNPMVVAAVLVAGRDARWRSGLVAMLLIGIAMQVKYSCMFEGMWIALWRLWRAYRAGARLAPLAVQALAMAGVALAPTLLAMAVYAALGHFDAFWFANFSSIFARKPDPPADQLANFGTLAGVLAPLLVVSAAGLFVRPADTAARHWARFLRGWLIVSVLSVLAFGSWFDHYALPVMAPVSCCAAAVLGLGRWGKALAGTMMAIAFGVGQYFVQLDREEHGTPAKFAAVVAAVGHGPGCLYVYGNDPMLYLEARRCTLTRYLFPSHLTIRRETGSIGVDQATEVNRIFDQRPAVVVIPPASVEWGEAPEPRRAAEARLMHDGYRARAELELGVDPIYVFALPKDAPLAKQPLR